MSEVSSAAIMQNNYAAKSAGEEVDINVQRCHISRFSSVVINERRNHEERVIEMQPRIKNAAMLFPEAMQALYALNKVIEKSGLDRKTVDLIHLRASQINGCSVCVDMHWRMARKAGESDERLFAVSAWRDAPYFTEAERAVLALTESVTRLSDRSDPVPDEVWNDAARHFDEHKLAALVLAISLINVWNRLNVSTKQVAGEFIKSAQGRELLEHAVAR